MWPLLKRLAKPAATAALLIATSYACFSGRWSPTLAPAAPATPPTAAQPPATARAVNADRPRVTHSPFRFTGAAERFTEVAPGGHDGARRGGRSAVAVVDADAAAATPEGVGGDEPAVVHIWSKAAIGDYLWEHVLGGVTAARDGGLWRDGNITVGRARLWFRSGWSVQRSNSPELRPRLLVLVLNAHEPKLARVAESWLQLVPTMPSVEAVGVVLHGSETCVNDWIRPYLASREHKIRFVFVTYATDLFDNVTVFQWPLGVAAYRGFPAPADDDADGEGSTSAVRGVAPPGQGDALLCNFFGTTYANSSREVMLDALSKAGDAIAKRCLVRPRREWAPKETSETRDAYIGALRRSAFTLCPAGLNTECYRWLEAAQIGSTPIIEAVRKPAGCGDPLALLKEEPAAPFQYVTDWSKELVPLLTRLAAESPEAAARRRNQTAAWYRGFRHRTRARFVEAVLERLVGEGPHGAGR